MKRERSDKDAAPSGAGFCIILRHCTLLGAIAAFIKAFSDSFK